MSRETSNEERWQRAPAFVVNGHVVLAVRCPYCNRRVVNNARSLSVHASLACPALYTGEDDGGQPKGTPTRT